MKLEVFEFIAKSENRARLFLRKYVRKNGRVFCTRCYSWKSIEFLVKGISAPLSQ
jgi:hypothetical protein